MNRTTFGRENTPNRVANDLNIPSYILPIVVKSWMPKHIQDMGNIVTTREGVIGDE
jgi:hypothetical protein